MAGDLNVTGLFALFLMGNSIFLSKNSALFSVE